MYEPPKCRKCGRVISFVPTKKGKLMPVDGFSVNVMPYVRGSVYYSEHGEQIRGYIVEPGTKGAVRAYSPHWYTCPFADENRKPRPDKRRQAIKEQVLKERETQEARQARKDAKERQEAEMQAAVDAQCCLFPAPSWR